MENKSLSLLEQAQERMAATSAGENATSLASQEIFKTEVYPEILRMKDSFIKTQLPSIYLPLEKEIKAFVTPMEITTKFYIRFYMRTETDPTIDIESVNASLYEKERKYLVNLWNTNEFKKNTSIYVKSSGFGLNLSYGYKTSFDHKKFVSNPIFAYQPKNGPEIEAKNTTEEELNSFVEKILTSLKGNEHNKG